MAEQHRQDAMRREELLHQEALAIRQEAHEKEKIAAKREKEIAEQNAKHEHRLLHAKLESEAKNALRE